MTSNTPMYDLPYLDGTDGGKQIKTVSKALAQRLEAVLANEGQVPLDADLVSLLQRVAALENAAAPIADSGWINLTVSAGWAGAGVGFEPRIRRIGKRVDITGGVALGNGGSYANILTIPVGYRPPVARFLGAIGPSSPNTFGQFQVQAAGALSVVYSSGATPLGMVVPLTGSWFID